ncbi:hypothetical protein PDE_05189 [Penicillium oxalicum 114-2]|uniref:1-phosphatidylinositol-3-phosphate 5-kinase n=1 Tax=Penicillium oxalicum (strain 114-2 / CGMCC 5302) TaxID=933388 RepID=S7ZIY6_PENO1|nr:hypothetical protein PDE_05189 [Penicillium oxalicum 114-2]
MESPSQGAHSPSTSSDHLLLGPHKSREVHTSTKTNRGNNTAALDQIHNAAAYQTDSLTLFNDFTTPPASLPLPDDKLVSEELQGGFSGLYSRLRTSVGGMRDIVSGGTKTIDQNAGEGFSIKSPTSERSMSKSISDLTIGSADGQQSYPNSSQGSRVHSPLVPVFHAAAEPSQHSAISKGVKSPTKSSSISSKSSAPPALGMKPNLASLTKSTGSSYAVDPAITQINVSAVGQSHHSRSSSLNVPARSFQHAESGSIGSRDLAQDMPASQSSSVKNPSSTHSPVMTTSTIGTGENENEKHSLLDSNGSMFPTNQNHEKKPRKSSNADQSKANSRVPVSTTAGNLKPADSTSESKIQSREGALSVNFSLDGHDESSTPSSQPLNTNSKASSPNGSSSAVNLLQDGVALKSRNEVLITAPARASLDSASAAFSAKPLLPPAKVRSPHPMLSRASTGGSTNTASSLPPLNTSLPRLPAKEPRSKRQQTTGDGVLSQLRSRLLSRDFWMRDENAKDCFHCGESFTTFRRKHHCRTCGQIFDSKCTLLVPGTKFGQPGTIRVCKPCEAMINAHEDDSSEYSDSEQSPIMVTPRFSDIGWGGTGSRSTGDDDDASSVKSQSIDQILKTPTMAIPATRRAGEGHNSRSAVLEINSDRPLTRPTSSRSLRSSLGVRPHSIGHKRHHSRQQYIRSFKPSHEERAPFQRRHQEDLGIESRLPAFHKDNIIDPDLAQYLSDDASSGDEQPSIISAVSEGNLSKSGGEQDRSVGLGGFLAAMKKGRSAFGDKTTPSINHSVRDGDDASITSSKAVNLPRSSRRRNLSVASSVHARNSPRTSKETVYPPDPAFPAIPIITGLKQPGFKMTRSSSMRRTGTPPIELNKASREHVQKLLRQLLQAASLPSVESWEKALTPVLLKAADEVDPDVQRGDDMDIRHYIKLKKIPGGRPGDTSYVSGLVFTKNLALKSMPRSIPRPNILIITFPLEYARQQQQFMSLEPVIRQEREFLENLVSRIAALHPNLLLVGTNVSGLALALLEQAGIATAYNVKASVLEAVSRCTQTRIVTSMDKLLTTEIQSECSSFDVKTYVHNGRKKTYMYISGCPKELGCTIVLRGGGEDTLGKVKQITEFMVYVVYNLRLETYLMRDEFAKLPALTAASEATDTNEDSPVEKVTGHQVAEPCNSGGRDLDTSKKPSETQEKPLAVSTETIDVPDDVPMPTYHDDLLHDHQTKILSASPFVKFEPPYLLMRTREMERRLEYLKRLRDQVHVSEQGPEEQAKPQKFVLITPQMVQASPHDASPKVKEVLRAAHDAEYDRALYHYQTQKRQWEAYVSGNSNMFDPYAHQNIVVLFSLVCTSTSVPCSGPDTFALEFYNEHGDDTIFEPDCTIGQYVEDLCHTANVVCNVNGCEKRMFEHHRQYVHGDAQISVLVQPHPSKLRGMQETILMWSVCKVCGNETQVTLMSENTWKYSFGKYLEVSFWGRNMHARAGVCPHDLQRDHLRYFGFKDIAIRVQYDPIHLLEIVVPRPRVTWKVDNDLKLRNQVYSDTADRLSKFMRSVQVRLKGINVESVLPELLDECRRKIDSLHKKAQDDNAALRECLQEKYTNSRYWEVIPLNEVLRAIQEKVVEWDIIFADFERSFFPSEKDIKRLATLQLKKIFLDKDATSMTTEDGIQTPAGIEDEVTTTDENKPRMMRRMTLSPEKAQNVLVSVVEEHTGKKQRGDFADPQNLRPLPLTSDESAFEADAGDQMDRSPQDRAVIQEEVRHLDLAVPSIQSERPMDSTPPAPEFNSQKLDGAVSLEDSTPPDIKEDRSTLILLPSESIDIIHEQKDDNRVSELSNTPPNRPSAIPRLAEAAFRRSGKARSPPLVRAHSQPAHLLREKSFGARLSQTNSNESTGSRGDSSKQSDKKLTDRLGITALKSGRFASGQSLIPRSTPKRGSSRVSNLAKHFEQLSREFEKERQRERKQRAARGSYSRAFPRASSKPIVEVYRNVKEAVEEREPHVEIDSQQSVARARTSDEGSHQINEEFGHQGPMETPAGSPPQESFRGTFDPPEVERAEPQHVSDAEQDDGRSDEEHNITEDLHREDSQDEVKTIPDDESIDFKDLPKHERTTLLKMLTNFWSERSASGWTALEYPLSTGDHVFSDCNIIVREDEPSSLIAFALDSSDYKEKLASIQEKWDEVGDQPAELSMDQETVYQARLEHALLRQTGTHLKYQFQEGQAKMLCKVFYAEQFEALRKKCGVADRIVESLSRCLKWDSKGGKTKSIFLKTLDDRFVLKSLAPVETQAFLKFAPAYFQIMSEALFHDLPSAIAKMFGFYQIIIKNPATGIEQNCFLLLMENLFYDRAPNRLFDLKGSMRNRKVESTGEQDEVLLDENMVDFIYETPLFAREHSKKLLSQSVWNDTLFLGRQNVMDYSLMIAIDENRSELVVGIIDCIRTYTWDKKLESWIKDRGFAGGGRNRPTVTSPREYKSRFREAMARYVLQAPSCWHQFQSSIMYRHPQADHSFVSPNDPDTFDGSELRGSQ